MLRPRYIPPDDIFPPNPWAIEAIRYDARLAREFTGQAETMLAPSNDYLGLRGVMEEGAPVREPGVYLNGFYESRPISYGKHAYGFPKVGQSILNCPDGTALKLYVDEEPFVVPDAEVLYYRRSLDLRGGALNRDVRWVTPAGKCLRLRTVRLVSFAYRHLAAIEYELTAEDAEVEVVISSEFENRQPPAVDSSDPRLAEGFVGRGYNRPERQPRDCAILSDRTESSRLTLGCGIVMPSFRAAFRVLASRRIVLGAIEAGKHSSQVLRDSSLRSRNSFEEFDMFVEHCSTDFGMDEAKSRDDEVASGRQG